MDKKLYNTGIGAYAVLLVLAVVFYKERTILLDNSLFLFEILKDGDFTIQRHRFITVLPQIFPLLASKLSLSLKFVMLAYSTGFVLYHFLCYILCGLVLKNYRLGLVLLLTNVLIVTHTFFWGLSELLLGISLMFPLYALLVDSGQKLPKPALYLLLLAGTLTIAFSHPLIVFPFLFVSAFIWLSKGIPTNRLLLVAVNIIFVATVLLKKIFLTDAYEAESVDLLRNFKTLFPGYLSLYSNTHLVENWFSMYYWMPVVFGAIMFTYIHNRSWPKLCLVAGACMGYTLLVNVAYPTYKTPEFYMENMYSVLGVMLALPLVYDVFPRIGVKAVWVIFALVIVTSFIRISHQRHFYTNRIAWFRDYYEKYPGQKMMVPMKGKPQPTILMPWSSVYEFWLLSTLEKDTTSSIIIHENVDEIGWAYDNYRAFVTPWGIHPYKDLNPRYFKLADTSIHYSIYYDR